MKELNKFTIYGTIVGITSTTKRTVLNVVTMSYDRKEENTFLLVRFDRKVDVCGYNVRDKVIINGEFSRGILQGTSISYLPRPLDSYKGELNEDLSYKSTFITSRKNEIVISGVITNVRKVDGTPFTYVNIKNNDNTVKVTITGNAKDLEVGREIAAVGYLQAYETVKNKYSIVAINVIDYQLFDMTDYKPDPEADNKVSEALYDDANKIDKVDEKNVLEESSEGEDSIPNPFA